MGKTSKPIEDFLEFLRESEREYHMAETTEDETNKMTQDILHSLELEEHDYHSCAKLAKKLREERKTRRTAKDTMLQTLPILEWVSENRNVAKSLESLLGAVRKAERSTENRIYTKRTLSERNGGQ